MRPTHVSSYSLIRKVALLQSGAPLLLGLLLILISGTALHAGPNDVQVTAARKRVAVTKCAVGTQGTEAKSTENYMHQITVQNRMAKELTNLKVEYVTFVERQRVGTRKEDDVEERKTGSQVIEKLQPRATTKVEADQVELTKANLVGRSHFRNGGRIRAEDSIKGIWVQVTQDGEVVGEYINPPSLKSRGWTK